jgi:hypothetical protein
MVRAFAGRNQRPASFFLYEQQFDRLLRRDNLKFQDGNDARSFDFDRRHLTQCAD